MQSASAKYFGYDLELLFGDLNGHNHVLAAVSGGSDSVAMLYLLREWAKKRDNVKISVATIDHGLRTEATEEARQVGAIAKDLGLPHIVEEWCGEKPKSAVSQKARAARYALLSKIAHKAGATAIALGHNRDDQRETVLMRARRMKFSEFETQPDQSTNLGLAGMRPVMSYCGPPLYKPVAIVRPLLSIARAELRLFLENMDVGWIDDPSNEDEAYERVHLRNEIAAHPAKYPSAHYIGKFSDDVAKIRQSLSYACALFVEQNVTWQQDSGVSDRIFIIGRTAFAGAERNLMSYLLRVLIGVTGGHNFLISPHKGIELVKNIEDGSFIQTSIGSAIVILHHQEILILRENRNLPEIGVTITNPDVVSWDGRIVYRFSREHVSKSLVLKALGEKGVIVLEFALQRRLKAKPRHALFTQPAIFMNERPVFAPMLNWCDPDFIAPEWEYWSPSLEQFRPDCDFHLRDAISQLRYSA